MNMYGSILKRPKSGKNHMLLVIGCVSNLCNSKTDVLPLLPDCLNQPYIWTLDCSPQPKQSTPSFSHLKSSCVHESALLSLKCCCCCFCESCQCPGLRQRQRCCSTRRNTYGQSGLDTSLPRSTVNETTQFYIFGTQLIFLF
jgi:hypothetical protein